ncbi:MAG: hypothetical protein K5848_05550 [Lachnospiraceae bacterium]|nr:hypothetical protein [Lachnospiraceae bacterium]
MTKEKLFQIISENTGVEINEITEESRLYDELGIDSLELEKIVAEAEAIFDTVYDRRGYSAVVTVGELYQSLTAIR